MSFERMLDKEKTPSEQDILDYTGQSSDCWLDLHEYIAANYDYTRELKFYAKKYGWVVRYRKSGKTLVSVFPEQGAFSVLLVLGKKEVEKAELLADQLNPRARQVLENTEQLHDGRWLWLRVQTAEDAAAVKLLLSAKRKPKPRS